MRIICHYYENNGDGRYGLIPKKEPASTLEVMYARNRPYPYELEGIAGAPRMYRLCSINAQDN